MKKTVKYTGKGRPGFTPQRREKFLAFLRAAPNVAAAADSVGLSRRCAYDTRARDPEFAAAWDEAVETGVDALEAEAYRRAVHGTDRPVFYQGAECGVVREYSDTLVIFLLKGRRREIYGDHVDVDHELGASDSLMAIVAAALNVERSLDALPVSPSPVAPALAEPVPDGDEEAAP